MKENVYGPILERTLKESDEPLSAAQLVEMVGCSPQRVYTWIKANQRNLIESGTTMKGGTTYLWRVSMKRAVARLEETDGLEVGAHLTVTRMRLTADGMVATLMSEDGQEVQAVISL